MKRNFRFIPVDNSNMTILEWDIYEFILLKNEGCFYELACAYDIPQDFIRKRRNANHIVARGNTVPFWFMLFEIKDGKLEQSISMRYLNYERAHELNQIAKSLISISREDIIKLIDNMSQD